MRLSHVGRLSTEEVQARIKAIDSLDELAEEAPTSHRHFILSNMASEGVDALVDSACLSCDEVVNLVTAWLMSKRPSNV